MRFASALLTMLLVWAKSSVASAADPQNVRLEVVSFGDCATVEDLERRVLARTPRVQFVEASAALGVRARFTQAPNGHISGELALLEGGKETPLRKLVARSCKDAVEGMALILAITLDPSASAEPETVPTTTRSPTTQSPTTDTTTTPAKTTSSSGSASTADPTQPRAGAEPIAPVTPESFDDPPDPLPSFPSGPNDRRWHFGAFVAAEGAFGPAPELMPGVSVFVSAGLAGSSVWAPSLILGGMRVWGSASDHVGGTASFTLDALTVELCALRFVSTPVESRLCASGLFGRLSAIATNTVNSRGTVTRGFNAVGPLAIVALRIGSYAELALRVAPRVNLKNYEYEFGDEVFHDVGSFSVAASAGVGVRWP